MKRVPVRCCDVTLTPRSAGADQQPDSLQTAPGGGVVERVGASVILGCQAFWVFPDEVFQASRVPLMGPLGSGAGMSRIMGRHREEQRMNNSKDLPVVPEQVVNLSIRFVPYHHSCY